MLSTIISQLPNLSQQELKTLKAAIDELTEKQAESEPVLYDVLRRVIGTVPPYSAFKLTKAYKLWRTHEGNATGFIAKSFPTATKVRRQALMTFVIEALVTDLRARNVPITVGSVTKNLGRFEQVFEKEFPGYIESGLASMILLALKEK